LSHNTASRESPMPLTIQFVHYARK